MIPLTLQDYLVKTELPKLFDGFTLKNVNGEFVPLNIYPQYLPAKKGRKDLDHFPFITVCLVKGEDPAVDSLFNANLLIMAGVYDEDENHQGFRDCLNIIQKIYNHITQKRIINNRYEIQYPISWETNEENNYPFFYAGMLTHWSIGKITSNDLYV